MTLKQIKTERDEFAEKVCRDLKNALEYAEENPQESVCIVMLGRDGIVNTFYTALGRIHLLGAMEYAKQKVAEG